jgi:hypothetical protein
LIYVDNVPQPVLVRYLLGSQITVAELDELLKDLRQPKQRVRIVLEGTLRVATAGDYEIEISGGSASGGIHHLTFRGNREISVGDDLFKVDQRRFRLAAGDYPLQWELTGGELGSARLEIRPFDSAAEGTPPVVKLDPQKFVALQRQTKSERTIGQPRGK